MQSTNDIRKHFLDYFGGHGHEIVDSSPLVPRNDPTLMFTNAGMVQFKNVFTGTETRPYSRAATSQKCVRAGGKHNDLENVGYTARHHTFFEMLGNFSFGDYFKEEAIEYAWKLVNGDFGLSKDKIYVTHHPEDDEAPGLWAKISGLPSDRIIPHEENIWAMGDTGPCGFCSEIFIDQGDKLAGGPPGSPDEDGDRFLEIWNLVFMQFEQVDADTRIDLPKPSIDTGMGMERIAGIMQGVPSNYDIDLMRALVEASADVTNSDPDGKQAASHRVIADHLRSCSFLIADGVLPSNEGRGYVLRRIMRRAMRHAHMLGATDPVFYKLVPALLRQMGDAYPELGRAQSLISETLKLEETRFKKTLDRGLKLLDQEVDKLGDKQPLPGDVAFKLYDTYGFPVDLTADVLRAQNRAVDMAGFETAMENQRAEARKAWSGSGEAATEKQWFELKEELGATEFLGYDTETAEGVVLAILKGENRVKEAAEGDDVMVVTNQTPFYAESGGQVGDSGVMIGAEGVSVEVTDTQKKLGAVWVHIGKVTEGTLKQGEAVELRVNARRRDAIRAHHSATHLLHEALRIRLGDHIAQKGSLVAEDRLRFDISQPTPLSVDDIRAVEAEVNDRIRANTEVTTRLMPLDEAQESGARALFGEKYDEEVRVVSMGGQDEGANRPWSIELCGGTHVRRTGDIGLLKVVGESAVAAGVRRIEALTGEAALKHLAAEESRLQEAAAALKTKTEDVPARVAALLDERKKMEREISDLRRKLASGGGSTGADVKDLGGVSFTARVLEGIPAKELKPMADDLKKQIGSGVIALVAVMDDKASLVVGVTDDLKDKINAVDLVRVGAEKLGGKGGGGRPDMAQAGGPDGNRANEAIMAIETSISSAA